MWPRNVTFNTTPPLYLEVSSLDGIGMSLSSVNGGEGSRWVGEGRNYFLVLFDFVFAVRSCYLLGVRLSELSLGARALQVAGSFESRIANPW